MVRHASKPESGMKRWRPKSVGVRVPRVAAPRESLVEDGDDERADGALQEADEEHRDRRERELAPVRLEVE